MKYSGSLTSKGQVTVPREIRRRLGLKSGDRVEFLVNGRSVVVQRAGNTEENVFAKYAGILGPFPGGEPGRKKWLRDLRGHLDQ